MVKTTILKMKVLKAKKLPESKRLSRKFLKIHKKKFSVNDTILVNEEHDKSAVATIEKIYWNFDEEIGQIKIRWFYKPKDIPGLKKVHARELFDSNLRQEIDMEMVKGKAKVLKLEDFLKENDKNAYFTRSFYDATTKKIEGDTTPIS
ncbi:unnamed protein product [Blepharisma stoltei]|uniref:BAH domain-containing protein n=1 Tax=Blepharisma stoltei TaxID=1481888 RepID=A0AAU9K992_9CILI|nr:unnamed protein product [Blepharisma stoltei]